MINFDLEEYKNLLDLLGCKYQVVKFSKAYANVQAGVEIKDFCVLRHDIDYCLESALVMAKLEHQLNVSASYYFLVDSDYYNIHSASAARIIAEIMNLGHEVCLHFDVARYPQELHHEKLDFFASLLQNIAKQKITSVSYHNPSLVGLSNLCLDNMYFGYMNTYASSFNQYFTYASDSLCRFRDKDIFRKIANSEINNLHLLIHPIWWVNNGKNAQEKIDACLTNKKNMLTDIYQNLLMNYEKGA